MKVVERLARKHMRAPDRRPRAAARRSRPTTRSAASASCPPTAGTGRSASPTSSSSPTPSREVRGNAVVDRRRARARGRRDRPRHRLPRHRHPGRPPHPRPRRRLLDDLWQGSPRAHLGTTVAGFPNLFFLLGPNTGLGHSSMVYMIESQIAHVMDALRHMRERGRDDDRGPRPRRRSATTPGSSASSRARCGTPAARAGTSTAPAATPRSGRTGRGRFRRRVATLDPAEYALDAPVAAQRGAGMRVAAHRRGGRHRRRGRGASCARAARAWSGSTSSTGDDISRATCATRRRSTARWPRRSSGSAGSTC